MMKIRNGRPSGNFLILLAFVEMWERFSYYGMRALLVLYLTTQLGFKDSEAYSIYALFASVGYLGCVIFGYVADRFLGARNMVIVGGCIMVIGHALMAFSYMNLSILYSGIALIAVGTSAFKGNITNMLGLCYKELGMQDKQANGYITFYATFNFGSFFASMICGTIGMKYSWHLGFGIAGIGMIIGLITFLLLHNKVLGSVGTKYYSSDSSFLKTALLFSLFIFAYCAIVIYAMTNAAEAIDAIKYVGIAFALYYCKLIFDAPKQARVNLYVMLVLMFFFVVFYALEMQTGGLIVMFASRNVDLNFAGYELAAATIDSINPIVVVISGLLIGNKMNSSSNRSFAIKFAIGLACIPACFAVLYLATLFAKNYKIDLIYMVIAMTIMSFGEIFVGPLIQAKTSELAPAHQRGIMFGMLMFAASYANIVGNAAARFMSVEHVDGVIDPAMSLDIYQNGFLVVMQLTASAVLAFILVSPVLKKAVQVR